MKTKRTWIYCRVAHNEPDSADVLAIQRRKLETYANEHGFEIVGSSNDMKNDLTLDHPGLLEFHAAVENKVDILLIGNLSRLGRGTDKVTKCWQMLRDLGVSVYTADWGENDWNFYTTLLGMIDEVGSCSK